MRRFARGRSWRRSLSLPASTTRCCGHRKPARSRSRIPAALGCTPERLQRAGGAGEFLSPPGASFCLGDIPRIQELQESRAKDGLQVVGVGLDREGLQVLEPFARYYHLTFPILVGADRFGKEGLPFAPVTVLPTTYLVSGRDGRVIEKWEGVLPAKLLEALIDDALAHH